MRTTDFLRRGTRRAVATVAVLATAATVAIAQPATSNADPARNPDQLLKRYKQLSIQAEKSAEAMNHAQSEYDKQRKLVVLSRKKASSAQKQLDDATKKMDAAQVKIDALARASYRGARVNRLYAMLVSDSPQNLLDNMTDLEVISRQATADLRAVKKTASTAATAKKNAEKAGTDAAAAVKDAQRKRGDLQAKQAELQLEAIGVRAVYHSMTGRQLAALRGPKYDFDPRIVPKGTSPALIAVHAALTRIGDPYVWGATGPDEFDCSGLMVWAYKQAGKTIPRTSQAQMGGGRPVDRKDLKPGDLIIHYDDAHHVSMYVGDGYVIHASTFGVPVAVVPVDKAGPFNTARRY
ncbi:hydrolase Nlp/P60 [Gordonia iterans]|uniref:Hydrolase Nlp/P60 n=1 Tax=Gordonia iterans TaxID=1004901 RepID=A0A2S0KHB1_9ACTN|nr:C40 family peptidase [Gordonia iterans]AVM01021.1 hydrolase Nlp/P60 [Gordonia iterans]